MQGKSSDSTGHIGQLKILYFNGRSLLPKLDELRLIVEAERPDAICVNETWLSDEISNDELRLTNYCMFRLDRNRHGGGVLVYVKASFSVKVILAGPSDLELLVVSVSCRNLTHYIGIYYRPPSPFIDNFDRLCLTLSSLSSFYFSRFVLVGDFNVNYFCTNSFLYRQLELSLLPFNLCQIVTTATHNNPSGSDSLIDLVCL